VQRKHNQPLVPADLLRLIDPCAAKFVSPSSLRERDYRLVMTNGCFDLGLTANHVRSLQWAKNQGEKLVVAVNDDESVRRLKGEGRPIMGVEERKRVVAGLECVDFVVDFSEDTPLELVNMIMPDCLVKGGDYQPGAVAGYGVVPIIIHPLFDGLSTTEKINRLRKS
jgi:D-beta-D-heptose 7-phosphate kinase/D-beta-D-heptose 1-phosphate adenosyltransferase